MRRVLSVLDNISISTGKLGSFLVLVLMCVLVYEVVARYVFNAPTVWAGETVSFLFGGICIIASAWTLKEGRHISVDIVTRRLSPKTAAIISLVTYLFLFFPLVVVALWKGTEMAVWSWSVLQHTRSSWGPPVYPTKTLIVVAVTVLLLQAIAQWTRNLMFVIKGRQL